MKDTYGTKERSVVFLAASLGWAHDAFGLTIIMLLATPIMAEFSIGYFEIGFIFSAQYIATVPGAVLFGVLADKYGRKNTLLVSIMWDAVLTFLSGFAPNYVTFAILRILSGMGVSWGIAFSLLSEVFSPKRRGLFGGLVHSTFSIGYMVAAFTSLLVYPLYGWRTCFWVALFPIPIVLLLEFALPESRLWEKYREMNINAGEVDKVRSRELLTHPFFKLFILAAVLFWISEYAYHAIADWAPTFLHDALGFSTQEASSMIIGITLVSVPALVIFGGLGDIIGRRRSFALAASVGLLGTILLGFFVLISYNVQNALFAAFIIPIGYGSNALYGVWSSELFPTGLRATATSVIFSIARGLSVGGLVVGYLATIFGLTAAMLTGAIAFALMIVMPWTLPETKGKELKAVD